jgi:hypothetical protein
VKDIHGTALGAVLEPVPGLSRFPPGGTQFHQRAGSGSTIVRQHFGYSRNRGFSSLGRISKLNKAPALSGESVSVPDTRKNGVFRHSPGNKEMRFSLGIGPGRRN